MNSIAAYGDESWEAGGKTQRSEALARLPDAALVRACAEGDEAAWNALIARYEAYIYSMALRSGLCASDAEDVFQDVCLIMLSRLNGLRDVTRLPGWLAMITRREVWRRFRRNKAALSVEAETLALPENGGGAGRFAALPEEMLLALERRNAVQRALGQLPERSRRLLTLLYCEEPPCAYAEAAERLGIPVGSIGPERARSLKRLQKILESQGFE